MAFRVPVRQAMSNDAEMKEDQASLNKNVRLGEITNKGRLFFSSHTVSFLSLFSSLFFLAFIFFQHRITIFSQA